MTRCSSEPAGPAEPEEPAASEPLPGQEQPGQPGQRRRSSEQPAPWRSSSGPERHKRRQPERRSNRRRSRRSNHSNDGDDGDDGGNRSRNHRSRSWRDIHSSRDQRPPYSNRQSRRFRRPRKRSRVQQSMCDSSSNPPTFLVTLKRVHEIHRRITRLPLETAAERKASRFACTAASNLRKSTRPPCKLYRLRKPTRLHRLGR